MASTSAMHMSPLGPLNETLVARLHGQARADRWRVSIERFRMVLDASVAHAVAGNTPLVGDVGAYLSSLKLEDLALATACADGDDGAWEHFVRELRPMLYRAADAIDRTGGSRDLADSLYGELFGVRERAGARQSLFRYFHGRSSLSTWIRAVLSQRHVDRVRSRRKTEVLPADDSAAAIPAPARLPDPERARWLVMVQGALAAAVEALEPRDRLRLGCYYAQNLKLAAIGRLLGEHEATVSRHLTRTRRQIRDAVERRLRDEHGLSEAAMAECFAAAVDDPGAIDLSDMIGDEGVRKNAGEDRSKSTGPDGGAELPPSPSASTEKRGGRSVERI
jgi:RNA polymerase sigma factor (sigma-70 family)